MVHKPSYYSLGMNRELLLKLMVDGKYVQVCYIVYMYVCICIFAYVFVELQVYE